MTKRAKNIVDKLPLMPPADLWVIIEAAQEQLKAYQNLEDDFEMNPEQEAELFKRIEDYESGKVKARPWREAMDDIRQRLKAS